jgi:hypothetical protein
VRDNLLGQLRWCRDQPERREKILSVIRTLEQPEARECARWYTHYERLSPEAKARLKEQRAEEGRRAWMSTQPPTDKQLAYLRSLGYAGEVPDRLRASELIDRLVKGGQP